MAERRQRPATAALGTALIDFWRGDPSEVIAGFLPLPAIATMPQISRRFRNQQPTILFALARRHGVANAVNVASLDAIAASGRDWSTFCGADMDAWNLLPPETSPRFPDGSDKREKAKRSSDFTKNFAPAKGQGGGFVFGKGGGW